MRLPSLSLISPGASLDKHQSENNYSRSRYSFSKSSVRNLAKLACANVGNEEKIFEIIVRKKTEFVELWSRDQSECGNIFRSKKAISSQCIIVL